MQALSRRNDSPETASRPYSVDRDGFVMGEGAACLVLETEEHAKARGAKIYGEIVGGGVTADSYHITAPEPEGLGASRAVRLALEQADATPDDVTHINAHATSTPTGDIAEYKALLSVFGDRIHEIPVSATKASTGHLLGGTGALEAIFTILALRDRVGAADHQPLDAGSRDPAADLGRRDAARRRCISSPSATRSASAVTTPSSRSARSDLSLQHTKTPPDPSPSEGTDRGRLSCQAGIRVPAARDSLPPSLGSGASRRLGLCGVEFYPTLCSHTTGASSLAWRNGSSSSSHAAPRAT